MGAHSGQSATVITFELGWTDEAEQDLENILSYYLENAGSRIADTIYARIREQIESLRLFPQRCRPGRVAASKEYIIGRLPYIAVVDIDEDTILILNIVHTARKYPQESPSASSK